MNKYLLISLVFLSANAFSGINKWVDENGKVHYSDRPVPANVKASEIHISSSPVNTAEAQEKLQQIERGLERSREAREKKSASEKREASMNESRCTAARNHLKNLQDFGRIFHMEKGERVYLDDAQKQGQMDIDQNNIKTFCN